MAATSHASYEPVGTVLEPALALRFATIALGATAAVWHAMGAVALPGDAPSWLLVAAISLTAVQLGLTSWLALRPSRACLVSGAVVAGAGTVALPIVLASGVGVFEVVGAVLAPTLLVLNLIGATGLRSRGVLVGTTRWALVWVAIAMSVLVAGCPHPAAASSKAQSSGFICHLL
jgi:hypothetical protein